ncbi:hypothetical protein [Christiangramia sp. SM2212]|uniref:Phenylacetate-CoA ligase n=1 Tax=Christiangramia sediminicola TaxID=3073267 RepID=A0ABU1ELR7_9FLAO|nr:hypothetical protein [Christiangramia sp. SM2212]MDR5589340.1 hypothetical protein [Christiangramia sp. SM2212]
MLNHIKRIYSLIPAHISLPIIKITGIVPIFSKRHWEKVERLGQGIKSVEIYDELLNLSYDLEKMEFYESSVYSKFIKKPEFKNLKSLPILHTSLVRDNLDKFINTKIPGYFTTTGGSGRNPLRIYLSNKSYFKDRVYAFYAWSTLGYSKGDLKLTLRGVNLGDKLYHFNPMNNELLINIFLLNEDNFSNILKTVNKYKPVFGHGYPSAWYNFAQLMQKSNSSLNTKLKGIYFASESIENTRRNYVEEVLQTPVRSTYGFTERAGFAYELPDRKGSYRIALKYGLMEILKDDGNDASLGERGRIVCTGFINPAMPLVRYDTGDSAVVACIEKGFVTEIKDLKGRWGKDFILDQNNNKIFTTAINVHSPAQFDFRYIQLYQKEVGELVIKCVPFSELNEKSLKEIKQEFSQKLPNLSIKTEVCSLEQIHKTNRGKIPYLIKEEI